MNKVSFMGLEQFYDKEKSYISATLKYIEEVLKIEVEEFKISDLPEEWIQCIRKEAKEKNLLKENDNKGSFFNLI
jgi:hypothetical protein